MSSVVGGGTLLGQLVDGLTISYILYVKYQCIILAVLATAFVGSLTALGPDMHTFVITMGTLGCFVIGWIDNTVFQGVTMVIEPQDIGLATGVMGSIRALGGAVAQALYVSILTNKAAVVHTRDNEHGIRELICFILVLILVLILILTENPNVT